MKKYIIATILSLVVFCSCDDFLDKGPLSALSKDSYWESEKDVEYAINGMYEAFYEFDGGGIYSPGGAPYMDVCTDLIFLKVNWEFKMIYFATGNLTADNDWVYQFWNKKSQQIRNVNFFFESEAKIKSILTEDQFKNYCGQARVIRAFCYMRMVQGFGDVPFSERTLSADEWLPRTSADIVMEWAIEQLGIAAEELPETGDNLHGRIFKDVAYAYQARAALHYAGFYDKPEYYKVANQALQKIVSSNKYELFDITPDRTDNFNQLFWEANEGVNNKEIIFSYQYLKDYYPNNISTNFAGQGWKGMQAQQNCIDLFECEHGWQAHDIDFETMNSYRNTKEEKSPLHGVCSAYNASKEFEHRDPRLKATFFNGNPSIDWTGTVISKAGEYWAPANYTFTADWENDCYFYKKLVDPTSFNPEHYFGNSANNFPLVRYSDMLLLYAETLNELGKTDSAAIYVNKVRQRVAMPAISTTSKEEMLEIIKHERKIELLAEDVLFWDYLRWKELERTMPNGSEFYGYRRETFGKNSVLMQTKHLEFPKYSLWPIPAYELRNNPNIKGQNPGW